MGLFTRDLIYEQPQTKTKSFEMSHLYIPSMQTSLSNLIEFIRTTTSYSYSFQRPANHLTLTSITERARIGWSMYHSMFLLLASLSCCGRKRAKTVCLHRDNNWSSLGRLVLEKMNRFAKSGFTTTDHGHLNFRSSQFINNFC